MDADPGYITVHPTVRWDGYNVVAMRAVRDDYEVFRISDAMTKTAALELAKRWAFSMGWRLEVGNLP